jgi:AcrR family transcriptional regulator
MPQKTFLHLPEPKKSLVLKACFEEFAINNYEKASVSAIVKKLGIAKGSMYQYFKSKRDLYFFLIEHATEMRLKQVDELFSDDAISFKNLIVQNFMDKVAFDKKHPIVGGFLFTVMKERFADDLGNMEVNNKKRIVELTKKLISKYQMNRQLRTDVTRDAMAFAIVQVQIGLYDFIEMKYDINYLDNIKHQKPLLDITESELRETVEQFADILINGLKIQGDD